MRAIKSAVSLFCAGMAFAALGTPAWGLAIAYHDTTYDRFSSGYSANPVVNPGFFAAAYDFSGVGWDPSDDRRNVAMISPLHFVTSWHFYPTGSLAFMNRDGVVITNTVSGITRIGTTDLAIGRLTAAISPADEIAYYPVVSVSESDYLNQWIWPYGKYFSTIGVGSNRVAEIYFESHPDINTQSYIYYYGQGGSYYPGEAMAEGGDSGSPDFIAVDGELRVVGGKSFIANNPNLTGGTFLPYYYQQVDSVLAADGYHLMVVPEPGAGWLMLAGTGGLLFTRRRVRQER
jgi:hypothetical protein